MMRFNSIGSFIGSRYTNRALPGEGVRSRFVVSIGFLNGGPPGIRTLNLRIKRCPHPLTCITKPYINRPPYVPCVPTAPGIGSEIGSTGSLSPDPSTFLLIVSNTLNGFSIRRTRNTKKHRVGHLDCKCENLQGHTRNTNKYQHRERAEKTSFARTHTRNTNKSAGNAIYGVIDVQGLHGASVPCYLVYVPRQAGVLFTIGIETAGGGTICRAPLLVATKPMSRTHRFLKGLT